MLSGQFILVFCLVNVTCCSKLCVILLDGFRWDYFDLPGLALKGFSRLRKEGVKAEYMVPDFPTNSFPNYRSIETGLHVESHGFVGNYMYDDQTGKTFDFVVTADTDDQWFDGSEAFFVTAEKQGFHTGLYYIPSTAVSLSHPSFSIPYSGVPSRADVQWAMEHGLHRLQDGTSDIMYLYQEIVDNTGHFYGPGSDEVRLAIQEVDDLLDEFLKSIDELDLTDKLDIIVMSDHGMTSLNPNTVDISGAFSMEDITGISEAGTFVYIWPKKAKLHEVYESLKSYSPHVRVYYKADIFERWYLKNHKFVPPLIAMASPGWYIEHPKSHTMYSGYYNKTFVGNHGYDNTEEDMRAIFLAKGPSFKTGYAAGPFSNVNVYQLICHVAGIKPRPHNGTWSEVKDMLRGVTPVLQDATQHVEL